MSTRKDAEAVLADIELMFEKGDLDESSYYKCLVSLASEWLNLGDVEKTLIVLNKCSPIYFYTEFMEQLETDPLFAQVAVELVYKIGQYGIMDLDLYHPTMPPAEA